MLVYADLFFLSNGLMDYLLLWATARFTGARAETGRLLLAAVLGAGYATAFLFPGVRPLYSVAAKAAFSLLMVAVAFPVHTVRALLNRWACFVVLSLAAGGGALALAYLRLPGADGPFPGLPTWLVALAVAGTLALAGQAWALRRRQADLNIVLAEVALGVRRVTVPALVDTGNQLRDPFSGRPVLVVEYTSVRRLLPPWLQALVSGGGRSHGGSADTREGERPHVGPGADRLCLIPFTALGTKSGLLYGFRPDRVRIREEGGWQVLAPVVVAVCPGPLSSEGWYQALLPGAVLRDRLPAA